MVGGSAGDRSQPALRPVWPQGSLLKTKERTWIEHWLSPHSELEILTNVFSSHPFTHPFYGNGPRGYHGESAGRWERNQGLPTPALSCFLQSRVKTCAGRRPHVHSGFSFPFPSFSFFLFFSLNKTFLLFYFYFLNFNFITDTQICSFL